MTRAKGRKQAKVRTYCAKCVEEIKPNAPEEVLDENGDCLICGMPKVCPNCSHEQEVRFADFPLIVCMDCVHEADAYLQRMDEVNESVNQILRGREEMGFTPDELIIDATMQDRPMWPIKLKPGIVIKLEPVPMVFAVGVVSHKGEKALLDFVPLCPSAMKRLLAKSLREAAPKLGTRLTIPQVN